MYLTINDGPHTVELRYGLMLGSCDILVDDILVYRRSRKLVESGSRFSFQVGGITLDLVVELMNGLTTMFSLKYSIE